MNRDSVVTASLWILLAVFVGSLLLGGIASAQRGLQKGREELCADLGERLGYETELIGGHCYIKIRPGLKVRPDQVVDFLPVIDCK